MSSTRDQYLLREAYRHALYSRDPSTRVGAVLAHEDHIISAGFNDFPEGITQSEERWTNRDLKLRLIVHAEMNAVLAAAKKGRRLSGSTLYLCATDDSGLVWGGCPCVRCTVELLQAGIREVVSYPFKGGFSKWEAELREAKLLLAEAGIAYREIA
ncbi:MAG TPA: hypothetical protein VIM56_03830 [Rhizomicrobium sp.]